MHTQSSFLVSENDNLKLFKGAPLSVVTRQRQGTTILSVEGEIDLLTAPQLTEALLTAITAESRCLIIDLTGTTFLSSAGMQVLIDAQSAVSPSGHLGVVANGPATAGIMKLVGLDNILTISPTVDAAITTFIHADRDDMEYQIA
ncbi:STAS domain-containing protein [Williamsia soli]|uniref:STAS domain-containing protein n=1 Tax=Williamsia soli TaxID=364929 RepID=UPI001AA00A71|nr:STAS domain-containing protein [Williamsia soli]